MGLDKVMGGECKTADSAGRKHHNKLTFWGAYALAAHFLVFGPRLLKNLAFGALVLGWGSTK